MLAAILLTAAAPAALAQPLLRPWSALVGHCFAGSVGKGATDRHCFEAVYGGQHIRDRHSVVSGGKEVYAGETIYSVSGSHVIFTYWNSLGGLGTGSAAIDGGEWRFTGTIHAGPTDPEQPIHSTWKIVPEGYEVRDNPGPARLFKRAD